MNSTELSELVVESVKDLKGQSIRCINVERLTSITDYMVIVTGTSSTHLKAIAESVNKSVKEAGQEVVGMEGKLASEWVLVDLGGVVLHLMLAPVRALYNLEELWNFEEKSEVDAGSESPEA
ncbi:MAG: ribosome silencing factor [Gammaproteobacteria bacterium]|nr:ribosome silencing factor [Gammaproteobacteria bacterium]